MAEDPDVNRILFFIFVSIFKRYIYLCYILLVRILNRCVIETALVPEFPESGFSSLDSESETLLLSKTIPRPSLVQPCKTRPSPRLRRVLDRETWHFESESIIP